MGGSPNTAFGKVPADFPNPVFESCCKGSESIPRELLVQILEFAISPFVQETRGIALKVETLSGQPVDPAIPMPISPPPPPLEPYQLTRVAKGSSFLVHIREPTSTVFPGPGDYRMTVVLFLMDVGSQPSRRLIVESAATTVHVNK